MDQVAYKDKQFDSAFKVDMGVIAQQIEELHLQGKTQVRVVSAAVNMGGQLRCGLLKHLRN